MPPVRETRHLWVGNLPDSTTERDVIDYFQRYGRIDSVKILPKRSADGGQAAFVDFVDIRCAIKAHETPNRMGDRELRTDYNDPASSTLTRSHDESGRPRYDRGGRGLADDGYSRQSDGYSGSYGYKDGPPRRDYDRVDTDERSSSRLTDENPDSFRRITRNPPKRKDSESGQSGSGTAGSDSGSDSSGSGDSDSDSDSDSSASEAARSGAKKPIALQIRNLAARSNDTTIRGGLYHEFKKHGDVGQIKVFGRDSSRYAIVHFRRPEDVIKAMEACRGKMFLGLEMDISLYEGDEHEERGFHRYRRRSDTGGPGFNSGDDVYQFNATRTIFVGNIERSTNSAELKRMFERYGEIVDIDIKKQGTNGAYAFIQYLDITHAVEAKKQMNRTLAGRNRLKIGFGKGMPTSTVWVGGLTPSITEDMLDRHFTRYGRIKGLGLDRKRGYCMVSFEHIGDSTSAHNDLKERTLFGKRVRVDYASRESQIFFYDYLVSTGQSEGRRYEPSPPPPMRSRGKMYDEPMRPRPGMRPGPKYHPYDHGYDRGPPFVERGHRPYDDYFRGGGGGYDSDDFGQELREYSRERAREREPDRRAEPLPRRRHHRGHPDMNMDSDGERYYPRPEHSDVWPADGRRERGSPDVDPRDDGHGGRRSDKRRDGDKRVQERRVEDKRPPVRIRYDSEDDIENTELPPPIEKKERTRDKSLRKKPIDARDEDENPDFYPTGYDKAYGNDEGKIKSVVTKRKVKTKEATSAEEDIIPPEELPLPPEVDTLARKEERNADKPTKKIKHKEGKKKRKHKKSPEDVPSSEEPPKSNPPVPVDFDEGKYEAHETRVEKRGSPERKARKSDVVMKSVVVERSAAENSDNSRRDYEDTRRPRSPTPEEHLISRKRVHSPERNIEYPRNVEDSRRVDNTRGGKSERHEESGRHDDGHRYDEVKPKKQRASTEAPPPPPPPPPYSQNGSKAKPDDSTFQASGTPRNAFVPTTANTGEISAPSRSTFKQHPTEAIPAATSGSNGKRAKPASSHPSPTNSPAAAQAGSSTVPNSDDTLMELLRRHPVMWQGLLGLKNDSAAIQMHYVSGNSKLAEYSLPKATGATGPNGMTLPPVLRIAQRMRMEVSQLEGVTKRMTFDNEHCLLLALPCGRDPLDVHAQTRALKNGFIAYLQQKQAAGIINIAQPGSQQASFVLHVFPPCEFTHSHLSRVAPNLLDSATDSGHLMVVVATV